MTGYIGKKVDIVLADGKEFSGYVTDYFDADDSSVGEASIELSPLDKEVLYELPVSEIKSITVDDNFKIIDFRGHPTELYVY